MKLPKDPYILLSYINTKLRNESKSLDDLCQNLQFNQEQIIATLSAINYVYNHRLNQFISNLTTD